MKKTKFFGSMLTLAFSALFVFASCTNKTKEEQAKEDLNGDLIEVREGINEDIRDFNNYTYEDRDKLVKDTNDELQDMNEDIADLKAELVEKGDVLTAETRAAYERNIAELEVLRDNYRDNIARVQNSTEANWEETKTDVNNTFEKAKKSVKQGWEDVKRGVNEGVNKTKEKLD